MRVFTSPLAVLVSAVALSAAFPLRAPLWLRTSLATRGANIDGAAVLPALEVKNKREAEADCEEGDMDMETDTAAGVRALNFKRGDGSAVNDETDAPGVVPALEFKDKRTSE
ncbi:hypothetical protein M406DRAFT_355780 [Cryphonectria parasitica EP155]|uniref:Uncharacterized protein n=1 Tax=Cryphonectria parasitica (strain ATCC 38755 / EP155) TaxID=660469 RepID=A0A9P5CS51_CRYP1|nr:uncharacterized protein M406DRAFT_355780 [Cryphonectria parasitica EP155]KAF3767961.1 hypothetical protein M406DRAFT_355780 [Cryphonectria parasitica EP155]